MYQQSGRRGFSGERGLGTSFFSDKEICHFPWSRRMSLGAMKVDSPVLICLNEVKDMKCGLSVVDREW